jgi:hypothetical protein
MGLYGLMVNDASKEHAMNVIHDKVDGLLRERRDIRQQRATLDQRDRAIDRDLADCVAAARVFGVPLELPPEPKEGSAGFPLHIFAGEWGRHREVATTTLEKAQNEFERAFNAATVKVTGAAPPAATPAVPMPKVRDIVLDQLEIAGSQGTKATPIRDYIEHTYNKDIHWKTVGMTLYRLSKDGLAHRKGQTWFFGPPPSEAETKNPGVDAPGSETSAK